MFGWLVPQDDITVAFTQVYSLDNIMVSFDKEVVEKTMALLRKCVRKVLEEHNGCVDVFFATARIFRFLF